MIVMVILSVPSFLAFNSRVITNATVQQDYSVGHFFYSFQIPGKPVFSTNWVIQWFDPTINMGGLPDTFSNVASANKNSTELVAAVDSYTSAYQSLTGSYFQIYPTMLDNYYHLYGSAIGRNITALTFDSLDQTNLVYDNGYDQLYCNSK